MKKKIFILSLLIAVFLMAALPLPSQGVDTDKIDWQKIPSSRITLIYPGTTSFEFLISDDHRLGGRNILRGKKDCKRCHLSKRNELDLKADEIVSGALKKKRSRKPFEPDPLPGKKGLLVASLKAAYDDEFIYVMVMWPSTGVAWPAGSDASGAKADRVSMQINKSNDSFRRYGCFITCHNDLNTMPDSPGAGLVAKDPYYAGIKRKDVRLYAYYTRDGAWNRHIGKGALAALRKAGGLIDLWTMEISGGSGKAGDGSVFEDRLFEKPSHVEGSAVWTGRNGGSYTAFFKRKLDTGDVNDVNISAGETFSLAVAIHDGNTDKRRHYVSFPSTVGIGADVADIKAYYLGK